MSLTKATLLKAAAVAKPTNIGEFFGEDVYVKSVSEFQRSRRIAAMYDAKNERMRDDAVQRARCLLIVDHVCNEDGESVFTDGDVRDLQQLDASKLDILVSAIETWIDTREGKQRGK